VIEWLPADKELVVSVAVALLPLPLGTNVLVPSVVAPSLNVTVPDGVELLPTLLSDAVKVTDAPTHEGLLLELKVVLELVLETVTVALPLIVAVQEVLTTVATTVYVPAAVWLPNEIAEPVPATGDPTLLAPFLSW